MNNIVGLEQEPLFDLVGSTDDVARNARMTQGPKYAGSKLKLLPEILDCVGDLNVSTIWDAFSGSTRVSQALARSGYIVECNDVSVLSEVFGTAFLLNQDDPAKYTELIQYLNALPPVDGWFTENYGGYDYDGSAVQPDGTKRLWQVHNTRKLDAIREEIDRLKLDDVTRSVALASLILALDSVDSSMGHFSSYLREWSPRSYNRMELRVPNVLVNGGKHVVTRRNVLETCNPVTSAVDLAYLDPPYGSNNEKMPPSRVRYQSYYHIWTSVILNDRPEVFGAARRRSDSRDRVATSEFEEYRRNPISGRFIALESIEKLISRLDVPWVLLSYSNGGRATREELADVLSSAGDIVESLVIDHQRNVMAHMRWTNEWISSAPSRNEEFLFVLKK